MPLNHVNPPLDARRSTLSDLEPLELAYSHMPGWLLDAPPDTIAALSGSMAQSRSLHAQVGKKFAQLQSVEAFCGALLAAEVLREFGSSVDVHGDYLSIVHVHAMADDSLLGTIRYVTVRDEPKTLLWSALQNFSESEAQADGFNPDSKILDGGRGGLASSIRPHRFAALCRRLDLGRCYQSYLQQFLGVAATGTSSPDATQVATEAKLRQLKTSDMEVDAHVAFLKKNISESAYKALLAVLTQQPGTTSSAAKLDGKPVFHSSLSILDTVIDGVVIFSPDTLLLHPEDRVVAYIPNDPVAPFFEFSSLQVFTDELKHRLRTPAYVDFFTRFVALSARPAFLQKVYSLPERLYLTATPLGMCAAHYLTRVQLKNMFADAQILAVPTGVLDEKEREERWQFYKTAGLMLINVAALFVPVLGDLMLAVAIGEMLKEVYEGVEDWSQGDTDHAREHLLNVAKDIAINATVAVGAAAVSTAASRLSQATLSHFEGFEPIVRDDGTARLWNKQLDHYAQPSAGAGRHTADVQGFFGHQGNQYVEVDGKHFAVEFDQRLQQWRIAHPNRASAFKPALLHNSQGAWQHAHERPLEWEGSATLLGRLGGPGATLDEHTLEHVRQLTDTSHGLMRRVHLDNLAPPPLLNISLKRFEIDRQITTFIEQMSTLEYNARRWTELQLQLLPHVPGWPAGKGLAVTDTAGRSLGHYGNPLWPTRTRINLPSAVLEQGKLLDAVLAALSDAERVALLGAEANALTVPAQTLARALGAQAGESRSSIFERLLAQFDMSSSPLAIPLERAFPGLPRSVAQTLVESATDSQRDVLRTARVPLVLGEMARLYVREGRINRALEGFYLSARASADTDALTLHFLARLRNFPSDLTLEIRENSLLGSVTQRWGNVEAMGARVLVKTAQGYQRYRPRGPVHVLEPGGPVPLLTALFDSLKPHERLAMGFALQSDGRQFNAALASLAAEARQESAGVLGLQPIKPGFKYPVTLPGGQIGYPLCGLGAGAYSAALQRRVRDIYPEFDNDQVVTYLEDLIEGGLDPLRILRERKRERKALMESLQSWVDATPDVQPAHNTVHDYSENRYRVAVLIERSWSKSPKHISWANPDEVYSLNLDGFRLDEFPTLPDLADLSHVRELKLSNMDCRDTASTFLEHFRGVVSLEMDNNRMTRLPPQLTRMPNLQRLSLARNRLYLSAENAAVLGALSKLEVLNLNDNVLGPLLTLDGLSYLRRVYLRRTWIDKWPQGLISRPLLESADLRENRLTDIPEHVYLTSPSFTRSISLSSNPLSAASRLRLARNVMQGGGSMGIRSDELISEAAAFEFWTVGITSQELRRRELMWNRLRSEPAADDFFVVLSRLTATADAQSVRHDLSRRVWEMIEAANENSALRRGVLDVAASPRSCSDSVAFIFSAMETQMQLAAVSGDAALKAGQLLSVAKRQFRLDKISQIAATHYTRQLAENGAADELEIHLAYRVGLAQALDLSGQPGSMTFSRLAGVTQQDLEVAQFEVENAEKTPQMNIFISTLQFWKEYLIKTNKVQYTELTKPHFDRLGELLLNSPQMSDERYLRRVGEIRQQMDDAVDAWSLEKTNAMLAGEPAQATVTAP